MKRSGQTIAAGFDPEASAPPLPWLAFALVISAIPPVEALFSYVSAPFTVQDDARQFVFWMYRWIAPDAFAGDLIAGYFESVTPLGFKTLYYLAFLAGIDPFLANALLPLPLGLIVGYYAFRLSHTLLPAPGIALLAVWLTVFFVWLLDTVASGTPRAFAVPLLLAFACCLVERRSLGVFMTVALTGLFYPQMTLIACAALGLSLLRLEERRPAISRHRDDWWPVAAGVVAAALVLAPFALATGEYGPTLSAAAAKGDPLFQPGGRAAYFVEDPLHFFICGERSGFIPDEWGCGEAFRQSVSVAPALAIAELLFAVAIPVALLCRAARRGIAAPSPRFGIVAALVLGGLILWAAAHYLAFELHLPSRYGQYPFRAFSMICLALILAPVLCRTVRRLSPRFVGSAGIGGAVAMLALPIALPYVPNPLYVRGDAPELYRFLEERRPGGLVATLSDQADLLPSLARRPVLTAREYMIPYATRYHRALADRTLAMIEAQYARDPGPMRRLIRAYGVTDILVDSDAFAPDYLRHAWWAQAFPQASTAIDMASGPALRDRIERCRVFRTDRHIVLDAACVLSE